MDLPGERNLNLVYNLETFVGFNFNLNTPFDSQFNAPAANPVISVIRDKVTWSIDDFNTSTYVRKPEGTTHFKLALTAGYVSNYEWDGSAETYEPVEAKPNGVGAVTYSDAIALGGMVGSATNLTIDLSDYAPIPVTTALFAGSAIIFTKW